MGLPEAKSFRSVKLSTMQYDSVSFTVRLPIAMTFSSPFQRYLKAAQLSSLMFNKAKGLGLYVKSAKDLKH